MCTINEDHMMYGSWHTKCKGQSFESFWAIFCPLTLLTTQKIKILKEQTNSPETLSFYSCAPQKIIWCMVPEMLSATNRIFGYFLPFYPPKKSKLKKKMKKTRDIIILHVSTQGVNLGLIFGSTAIFPITN